MISKQPSLAQTSKASLKLANVGSLGVTTSSLDTLPQHSGGLVSTDTSTPVATMFFILVGAGGVYECPDRCDVNCCTYKLALAALIKVLNSRSSSFLTSWRATTAAVFLCTTVP